MKSSNKLEQVQHGYDCKKEQHTGNGYLHHHNDDAPYDVDGCIYCGRCHHALSKKVVED